MVISEKRTRLTGTGGTLTGTAETTAASPRTIKELLKRMATESGRYRSYEKAR